MNDRLEDKIKALRHEIRVQRTIITKELNHIYDIKISIQNRQNAIREHEKYIKELEELL